MKHKNCIQCLWKRHKWTFISISFKLISTLVPPRQLNALHKCIPHLLITHTSSHFIVIFHRISSSPLKKWRGEKKSKFPFSEKWKFNFDKRTRYAFFQLQDIPHSLSKVSLILNILSRFVPPPLLPSHSPLHLLSSLEKCINAALCVSVCMCRRWRCLAYETRWHYRKRLR